MSEPNFHEWMESTLDTTMVGLRYHVEAMNYALRRAEFAEAQVQRVRELHRPRTSCVECMGWDEFDEEHDESHTTDQVCNECREDMDDELFGVVWPCPTIRAIGGDE